jgi:hypothetical protein
MWDWIKDNWAKIVFGLFLALLSFGVWCMAKFINGLRR